MADNSVQLHLQAVLNNLRQLFSVPFMRFGIGQITHCILRTGNRRRIQLVTVGNRLNTLNHVRNLIGIRNNNLVGCLLAQIRELLEHLLRSVQVQRRLQIRILVALTGLQNRTQLCILRIEEMHVAGCYSQLAQAFAQLIDFAVMLAQILLRAVIFTYQKLVIARRLDFQIIIKASDFLQLLIARTQAHRTVKLARFAGRAENQAFAMLLDNSAWQQRTLIQITQVADSNKLV